MLNASSAMTKRDECLRLFGNDKDRLVVYVVCARLWRGGRRPATASERSECGGRALASLGTAGLPNGRKRPYNYKIYESIYP